MRFGTFVMPSSSTHVFVFYALCFVCVCVCLSKLFHDSEWFGSERVNSIGNNNHHCCSVFLLYLFHFIFAAISCLHPYFFSPLFGYVQSSVSRQQHQNEIALIVVYAFQCTVYTHYALCNT